MRMWQMVAGAIALAVSMAGAGRAQTPEEIVRWIYLSRTQPAAPGLQGLEYLASHAQRTRFFSRRMVAFLAANDSHGGDLATVCLDFAPDIPGNDYDAQEIARTLTLASTGDAMRKTVTAWFTSFGQPAQISYDFVLEDGFLRIDDIAGPGFRLSLIPCTARQAVAPTGTGAGGNYCYDTGAGFLHLRLAADGSAGFRLQSWQGGGYSCSAEGYARRVAGGWLYEENLYGRPCRLDLQVTPDRGIRLGDAGSGCKMTLCGQRAVLDGLVYPAAAQVDCATLPQQ